MSTKTTNYNFTKPAENEYYDVNVQNDNWDKADDALTKKVTAAGGDIANTIVSAIDASTASFPVPAAKDKPRTFLGKIKKWQEDCIAKFGNYVLKSMISSQQINDSSKVPSSALAYLMQQAITENANDISVLNTKLGQAVTVNVDDLIGSFSVPTFVRWNGDTANTPYKDGKTTATLGWAIIYGTASNMISIFAGAMGTNNVWSRTVTQSADTEWIDVVLNNNLSRIIYLRSSRKYSDSQLSKWIQLYIPSSSIVINYSNLFTVKNNMIVLPSAGLYVIEVFTQCIIESGGTIEYQLKYNYADGASPEILAKQSSQFDAGGAFGISTCAIFSGQKDDLISLECFHTVSIESDSHMDIRIMLIR